MTKEFNWKRFVDLIKKVIDYKTKTSYTYINADAWEEVLVFALQKMGEKPDWRLGSHAAGVDIKIPAFAISAKSGKVSNEHLTISSYRLTRFDSLDKMINFIDDTNFDFYLCCARSQTDKHRSYTVYKMPANIFSAKDCKWKKDSSNYHCVSKNGVHARIVFKMSNQLWLDIPLSQCQKILEVSYETKEIASEFQKIFDS